MPPADQPPPEELIPRRLPTSSREESATTQDSPTVPTDGRSQSTASEHAMSNPASALPSPVSGQPARESPSFKPRGKVIAAVLGGHSRNGSAAEIVPREINLPHDPFVNGQAVELFLYKDATECPICFLSYPRYLNHTRCCDQPICSECFVQIKRPDPHFPEGHNEDDPNHNPEETAGLLVSEPACCPYCTQPDFGVSYMPPPFRRGLTYTISPTALGATSAAMSSNSSVTSATLSSTLSPPASGAGRRRNQSLSASSPNVILTDRIRPEWATKLQAARAHQARRSAAATALHTAAFLVGNADNRAFRSRFGRRNTGGSGTTGGPTGESNNADDENIDSGSRIPSQSSPDPSNRGVASRGPTSATAGGGRNRLDDLEEMMFMEAVRLSLAAEEERKQKAGKEERKDAKKREKEARKAAKAAAKQAGPYEGGNGRSGVSSASGSSLSLPGLSFGRKRGDSVASNLRVEASVASALAAPASLEQDSKDKGKGVDRAVPTAPESVPATLADPAVPESSTAAPNPRPIPTPHLPAGPSHLRQMSNASSVSSSVLDSQHGSYTSPSHSQDPRASGLSLGSRSGASEDGEEQDRDRDPSASTEPMFNFRSLAEVVGVSLDGGNAGRRLSQIDTDKNIEERRDSESKESFGSGDFETIEDDKTGNSVVVERVDDIDARRQGDIAAEDTPRDPSESKQPEQQSAKLTTSSTLPTPSVTATSKTRAQLDGDGHSKQPGYETAAELAHRVAQN